MCVRVRVCASACFDDSEHAGHYVFTKAMCLYVSMCVCVCVCVCVQPFRDCKVEDCGELPAGTDLSTLGPEVGDMGHVRTHTHTHAQTDLSTLIPVERDMRHVHAHTHARTHALANTSRQAGRSVDKRIDVCMCVRACVRVCVCVSNTGLIPQSPRGRRRTRRRGRG